MGTVGAGVHTEGVAIGTAAANAPAMDVVHAFGGQGEPLRLSGGQGGAYRAGHVVLKRLDMSHDTMRWQAVALAGKSTPRLRVAAPLRTRGGSLVHDGWTGWPYLSGRHERGRWAEVIAAGEAFHAMLQGESRPTFLDQRQDRWALGDRAAWGEVSLDEHSHRRHIAPLGAALREVNADSQIIHGDLTGNVLFHPTLPPAVIDVSPYWRPPTFASAIVVVDALVWEGADTSLLRAVADVPDFGQYLARALIFRLVTDYAAHPTAAPHEASETDPYADAVALAVRLATSG